MCYVKTMIIDISLSPCAALTCVVLLQAAHTFCVSVFYVHVVFDDKHVLNLMCLRTCMCLPQIKLLFFVLLMVIIDFFLGLLLSYSTWFV